MPDGSRDLKYSKDLIIVFNDYFIIINFYNIKSKGMNCKIPSLFNCSLSFTTIQTLRVFHLSYFKYVLQISFNSFQFISSKFWKSLIFNLFEVSFTHFQWNRFLNKFLSEIYMITNIITYFRSADYLFFILSGKWFYNFWCKLFWDVSTIYLFIFWVVNDCLISDTEYYFEYLHYMNSFLNLKKFEYKFSK